MINKFTIQKSFAISAGAGSGKTYTLSRRYINAILGFDFFREKGFKDTYFENLKPATTKQIVTMTYTEPAALEMKERIFGLISKIINCNDLDEKDTDRHSILEAFKDLKDDQKDYVLKTLQKALFQSSDAKISTIHSFCLDILKTNADIAKFDSKLDIIKEDEKDKIINESIFQTLNNPKNKEIIQDILKNLNLYFIDTIFKKYVTSTTFRIGFNSFNKNSLNVTTLKILLSDMFKLPDVEMYYEELCNKFDEERLDQKYKDFLKTYIENFSNFNAVSWSNLLKEFDLKLNLNANPFRNLKNEINPIKDLDSYLGIYKAIDQEKEELFYKNIEYLKCLMQEVKSKYDYRLKELGKLDFDEIISKTHEIIKNVDLDIKYIMIDEFQDTNTIQYEIIINALNEDSNLFVVGDSKQSIYAFQGAQIEVFNDAIEDRNYISSIEPMDVNFRSDGVILDNVNKIFENLLKTNTEINEIKQNYEATPQALKVSNEEKSNKGSFKFLINSISEDTDDSTNEFDQIAKFIANIKYGKLVEYKHITNLIEKNKKAIAVVFDAKAKMLELKSYLLQHNIECKVSASENFYHTKEVNDIFNLLMHLQSPKNKYYKAAALRSNILRYSDNDIYQILSKDLECEELNNLKIEFDNKILSDFILFVYTKYSFKDLQDYFSDSEQRKANLDKFLFKALEYENSNGNDTYTFLKQCEKNIYFSEVGEDEAFFKSDNLESIQLCTIHSTKGLAYPMVILANSDKDIFVQIRKDIVKNNSFTLKNGEKKLVTGFSIDGYEPLCFRFLKKIDEIKHLAEKKRLLYVALTRAEHDVIISGKMKSTDINNDNYLGMIVNGLGINPEDLYNKTHESCINNLEDIEIEHTPKVLENQEVILKEIKFEEFVKPISATNTSKNVDNIATKLGTITHKIFELYWYKFNTIDINDILDKFDITKEDEKLKIKTSIENFKNSDVYKLLKSGVDHRFELEFNYQDKTGFIDLIYFDKNKNGWVIVDFKTGSKSKEKEVKYLKQLDFYEEVLKNIGLDIICKEILWV
ncbi:UvrD-helicase domain-containing protein [Aliarcobacter cryaerophilus]|uniref:UvrD-helicase domain-containing protein n=1 Tax=Aliarcobacter cryaerophilus TaxID=28198 RepID=UPI0021B2733F|nr:UvrD-helicase domain-containing protein [Aliarcobacter cryaerophilus]MCT7464707.1 UvrD-helicase domain-containing protein [Aliarcobacter cryaerophilus]